MSKIWSWYRCPIVVSKCLGPKSATTATRSPIPKTNPHCLGLEVSDTPVPCHSVWGYLGLRFRGHCLCVWTLVFLSLSPCDGPKNRTRHICGDSCSRLKPSDFDALIRG